MATHRQARAFASLPSFRLPPTLDPPSTHTLALKPWEKRSTSSPNILLLILCRSSVTTAGSMRWRSKTFNSPLPNGRYFFGFSFCVGGNDGQKGGYITTTGFFFPSYFQMYANGDGAVVHLLSVGRTSHARALGGCDARLVASHGNAVALRLTFIHKSQ